MERDLHKGVALSTITKKKLLFANDKVIIADSEDNLQAAVFTLRNIVKNFGVEISPEICKTMVFVAQDPVTCKIVVDDSCLQVQNSKYLGSEISYEGEKRIQQKAAKFAQIQGIRNNTINLLKPTGYVMHHQFNIQQLYVLSTLYLCVLYLSQNKQRLVPLTA